MKKRLIVLILALTLCSILLCGCNSVEEEVATDATEAPTEAPTEKPTEASDNTTPYWKITGRYIKNYENRHFALFEDSDRDLTLELSSDWKLNDTDLGYTLTRDGEQIGSILMGSFADKDWKVEKNYTRKSGNGLSVDKNVESNGSGSSVKYRYRYEYSFAENGEDYVISLIVNYDEIDLNAADKLYFNPKFSSASNVNAGSLAHLDGGNILILGNSFIGTSNIGSILGQMLAINGKDVFVTPISRGYASVATYIADDQLMSDIEAGFYDGIFICGFYNEGEADNLVVLEEACKKSDTTLVIFPAHNEFENPINVAQQKCPELPILNWKAELDMLIESGVDQWELCWNDQHLHSTAYAGLVGAHMIYRSIYDEIPDVDDIYNDSLNIMHAKEMFGSYLESGKVAVEYDVYYMN